MREGVQGANGDIDSSGRRAGDRFNQSFVNGIRSGTNARQRTGEAAGDDVTTGVRRRVNRDRPVLANLFGRTGQGMTAKFKDEFNLGIGAARMGSAVIGALALATPSILSSVGALGSAVASQLLAQIAAAGPAIAGAGIAAGAGLATAALNVGLLMAAFKSGNAALDEAVTNFKALFKTLGAPVAEGMLSGFTSFVRNLRSILPEINDLLHDTGAAFGEMFDRLGQTLSRSDNLSRIKDILATNTTFVGNFSKGLSGLTTSFLVLFRAAKPFVDFLGDAVRRFGEWAEASLTVAESNGTLATFMTTMLDKLQSAGRAIRDFVVGIYNIGKAAAASAAPIGEIAAKFRAWTENPENQVRMETFFGKMHQLTSGLASLFGKLASAAGGALEKMDVTNILAVFQILAEKWGPALAKIWGQISAGAGKNLVKVFDDLGQVLMDIADSGVLEDIARGFSQMLASVTGFLRAIAENPVGAQILGIVTGLALFGGLLSPVISGIKTLIPLFSSLAGAISAPALAVAAIAAGFVFVYTQSQKLRDAVAELGQAIWDKLQVIWTYLQPALERLGPALLRAAQAIGDALAPIIRLLAPLITTLVGAFGALLVTIINVFTLAADFVTGWLTGDWQPFVDDWQKIIEQAKKWWNEDFLPWWNQLWEDIGKWASEKVDELKQWLGEKWDEIVQWAIEVWTGFEKWLQSLWPRLIIWAATKWEEFAAWLRGLWDGILIDAAVKWEEFKAWWNGLLIGLVLDALQAWETFKGWLFQMWVNILIDAQIKWEEFKVWLDGLWPRIIVAASVAWLQFQAWLQGLWQNVLLDAIVAWDTFSAWWQGLFPALVNYASLKWLEFQAWLQGLWQGLLIDAITAWGSFSSWWQGLFPALVNYASQKWLEFQAWLQGLWQGILIDAIGAWNNFVATANRYWNLAVSTINGIVAALPGALSLIWNSIVAGIQSAWGNLAAIVSGIWNGVGSAILGPFKAAYDGVVQIAGWISGVVSGILSTVTSAFDTVNSKLDEMRSAAAAGSALSEQQIAAMAAIPPPSRIEMVFGEALRGLTQGLDVDVNFGGALAAGGTVPAVAGGQMFLLGEAGRRERVEPLDSQGLSTRDRALIAMLVKSMLPRAAGSTVQQVSVRIGERELTDVVTDVIATRESSLARRVQSRRPQ